MTDIRKHTAYRFATSAMALVATVTFIGAFAGSSSAASVKLPSESTPLSYKQVGSLLLKILGPMKTVPGSTSRGINGHTITIGGVAEVVIGGVTYFAGMCDGAKAAFAAANKAGGVGGYKFNYVGCSDDGGIPTNNAQLIQTLVQNDNVFACVPCSSTAMTPQFLNKNHVPYFGFAQGTAYCGWNTTPFAFSAEGELGCQIPKTGGKQLLSSFGISAPLEYAQKALHLSASQEKVAIVGQQTSSTVSTNNAEVAIAKAIGEKVVYYQNPIPAPTSAPLSDYTPIAEAVVQSGANQVFADCQGAPLYAFLVALHAAGFKGFISAASIDNPLVLASPVVAAAVNGGLVDNAWYGQPVAYPSAEFTKIQAQLAAVGASATDAPVRDIGTMWSYANADMFINMLKYALKHIKGPLTTEKFVNVINAGYTYPGIPNTVCPAFYPQEHYSQSNCISAAVVNGPKQTDEPALPMGEYGAQYLVPYA
jgi:branched-chain amino acid transport system substrate-binding protein